MGKKKQAFLYVSMMLLFISFYAYAEEKHDVARLDEMIVAMETEQIELNEWGVYMKQMLHDSDAMISQLQDFTWEELDTSTMQGTYEYPEIQMKEIVTIIRKQHTPDFLFSYQASGTSFSNDDWSQAKDQIISMQKTLFAEKAQLFGSVRGKTKAEDERHANKLSQTLVKRLKSTEVESLTEEDFIAVSAFRKDWPNTLVTGVHEMNVQLAIRTNDDLTGRKTVTVGTPIITTEY